MAELKNPLVPAKRGRPSKTAPVVYDNVTVITSEERSRINELVTGIASDGEKAHRLLLSAVQKHFELGGIIAQVVARLPAGKAASAKLVEQWTGIPERQVNLDLKIYKRFKDKTELLEGLTMRDVAAIVSDAVPRATEKKERVQVHYGLPEGQMQFPDESFALPPLSGVRLDTFRVHSDPYTGNLWLLQDGQAGAVPIGSLTVEQPKDAVMKDAYSRLLAETQCAVERYYAVIEQEHREEGAA